MAQLAQWACAGVIVAPRMQHAAPCCALLRLLHGNLIIQAI